MANEFRFEDHPGVMKFKAVADEAISGLAAQYGFEFSDEYRAFLKAHNGFNFDRLNKAAPLAPGTETFDSISYLFGIDTGFEYNDLRTYLALPGVWDNPFRAFAYPVAEGAGGDPVIQIFKGNHETVPDAEELEEDAEASSPDQALSFLIDVQGCLIEVAKSFSDFINKLVVYDDDGVINVSIRRPLA
jgi:hypothetical protein